MMANEALQFKDSRARSRPSLLRSLHIDGPLLIGLIVLSMFGLLALYSASGAETGPLFRQLIRLSVAFVTMVVAAQFNPSFLRFWSPWIYLLGVLLLVWVLISGVVGQGAQRWIDLGFMRFQPSELMKLGVPMMAAWYLHDKKLPPNTIQVGTLLVFIAVPTYLIATQPDLGTSLLIAVSGVFVALLAGMRARLIALVGVLGAAALPALWYFMHDYQRQRVLTFLNPESDPLGQGYQIIQSKIAIGSGGVFGKGWLNGSQARLDFLPEPDTDFIFAVMGEEFGLLGLVTLLCVYMFIVGRGLFIAIQAQDTFSRLVAGSISLTFFVYVFVNAGMVTGIMPVVGVPLPLVSYGGTSMVTLMAGFGILMSVHTHRKLLTR